MAELFRLVTYYNLPIYIYISHYYPITIPYPLTIPPSKNIFHDIFHINPIEFISHTKNIKNSMTKT